MYNYNKNGEAVAYIRTVYGGELTHNYNKNGEAVACIRTVYGGELMHKDHKYIDKKMIKGKMRYYYDTASSGVKKSAVKVKDFSKQTVEKAKQTYENAKQKSKQRKIKALKDMINDLREAFDEQLVSEKEQELYDKFLDARSTYGYAKFDYDALVLDEEFYFHNRAGIEYEWVDSKGTRHTYISGDESESRVYELYKKEVNDAKVNVQKCEAAMKAAEAAYEKESKRH